LAPGGVGQAKDSRNHKNRLEYDVALREKKMLVPPWTDRAKINDGEQRCLKTEELAEVSHSAIH